MHCPKCGNDDSKVIESRDTGDSVRRRRECLQCSSRYTTYERIEKPNLAIIKKDKRRELFDRDKLKRAIARSVGKFLGGEVETEEVVARVEDALYGLGENEVTSQQIGDAVMAELARRNEVATLAIAAHFTEQQAQQNAQNELLERVSLASWWVYRLPTTDSIDVPQIGDYQIVTGVAPSIGNGNATFTIIRNDSEFPFFTLGGGYAQDLSRAAEKSYLEAVQSWTATRWLRHNNMDFPNWDLNELSRRFNEIQAVTDSAREHIDLELMEPITPITVKSEDIFVSYFEAQRKDFSGRSRDYASLSRPARQPVVFTEHNF